MTPFSSPSAVTAGQFLNQTDLALTKLTHYGMTMEQIVIFRECFLGAYYALVTAECRVERLETAFEDLRVKFNAVVKTHGLHTVSKQRTKLGQHSPTTIVTGAGGGAAGGDVGGGSASGSGGKNL